MGKIYKLDCQARADVSDVCWNCKNFNGENPAAQTCAAFPKGIPTEIWNGENSHTTPFPGDKGIRFEPIQVKRAA